MQSGWTMEDEATVCRVLFPEDPECAPLQIVDVAKEALAAETDTCCKAARAPAVTSGGAVAPSTPALRRLWWAVDSASLDDEEPCETADVRLRAVPLLPSPGTRPLVSLADEARPDAYDGTACAGLACYKAHDGSARGAVPSPRPPAGGPRSPAEDRDFESPAASVEKLSGSRRWSLASTACSPTACSPRTAWSDRASLVLKDTPAASVPVVHLAQAKQVRQMRAADVMSGNPASSPTTV